MFLSQFLEVYSRHRDVSSTTIEQYGFVILSFSRYLGREADLEDLTPNNVNDWLIALKPSHSAYTCKTRRLTLLTIWNLAAQLKLIPRHECVRLVRTPDLIVRTLNTNQIAKLRERCDRLTGMWGNLTIAGYLRTLVDATLETSLRQSDLHRIPFAGICEQPMKIVQKKTGYRRLATFSEQLIVRILRWHPGGQFIWPQHSQTLIATRLREIGRYLKIPSLTHTMLRKTAISDVEAQAPGSGWIFAGHRSPTTTQAWYTDRQQQYSGLPRPRL